MSPLDIHCLLEYYTMPEGSPDIKNRHPMAVRDLLDCGMIHVDGSAETDETIHSITWKGKFYVKALTSIPCPVQKWEIPDETT
jgi:hypothetical protein